MSDLSFGKLSDPEYGYMPERNNNMDDVKKGPPPNNTGCSRMGAQSVLQDKIKKCRKELDALEFLDRTVHWEGLSPLDEQLLWHYFTSH